MKDDYLLDPATVFLNHGSFGACPRDVFDAFQRRQREMEANPVLFLGRRSAELLRASREALAAYVGARADDLVYVPNATTGVNIALNSWPLEPGDEVLTTDLEYGACVAAARRRCEAAGATLRAVRIPLPFDLARFAAAMQGAIGPRTRLILVSHITSVTALVLPMRELVAGARARGVATLIDGAHAPGQVPLDLDALGADIYTGNCHKWLSAPKASAFLHARPEHHARLHAPVTSWGYVAEAMAPGGVSGGHTGFDAYLGRTTLERRMQWQGTRDIAAALTVPDAIAWQAARDWPAQQARCHAMALTLMHRQCARWELPPIAPDESFAQMVPIPVPVAAERAAGLRERLYDDHRIEVPVTVHEGRVFVRVSVQAYTEEADLAALERALERILAG
ncbi:MAG: aminotransferase class V-fold PLP-dependent enzyme [Rubrivivax sp.]|nr:aminotransferase class V-fold PLP-dependent enzyme [Rubrivivax sp.]